MCGLVSLLGCLFYITCAIMIWNRNLVFLEHKVGLSQFDLTDEVVNMKLFRVTITAIVSSLSLNQMMSIVYVRGNELLFLAGDRLRHS